MKTRIPMKLLAALTALCLLLGFGVFAMADEEDAPPAESDTALVIEGAGMPYYNPDMTRALNSGLAFKDNGQFKILVLSDLDIGIAPYPAMIKSIDYMIKDTQPDLIVLNGDVTRKQSSVLGITGSGVSIAWICDMIPGNIPFTVTFGENDALLDVSKNNYLTRYQRYGNFLGYDDMPVIDGVANHNLFIYGNAGAAKKVENVAFNLWMLDTNMDGLYRLQADWYGAKENDVIYLELGKAGFDYIIPSAIFTHKSLLETAGVAGGAKMLSNMGEFGDVRAAISSHNRTVSNTPKALQSWDGTRTSNVAFLGTPGMAYTGAGDRATRGGTLVTLTLNTPFAAGTAADVSVSVQQKIAWEYFNDDNPALAGNVGSRHAFYQAGVSAFFGPPASLIGWMLGLFIDKYETAYKITQFWGDTFNFML